MPDSGLREAILRKCRESMATKEQFFTENADRVVACCTALARAFDAGGRLFVMGNGGSSCDAAHVAVEFMHPIIEKRPALPAIALTTDTAFLTAVGNDQDFSLAYVQQLRMLGRKGDMVLGISTSGKSANINRALQAGREMGLLTVGFSGRDGGRMPEFCDHCFIVPSFSIHRIQETHETLLHVLWDVIHVIRGEEDVICSVAAADDPLAVTPFSACPVPKSRYDHILLGHGSGGQLTADLIQRLFVPGFANDVLGALEDQATVSLGAGNGVKAPRIAFTTDAFVVRPLFFPGGDIGRLAIHGTVNDLAVGGARPLFLSAAFILEEGLPLADLRRIVASMRQACAEAGVALVTGDTKVVDRGKGDGVFITTSGIGMVPEGRALSIHAARPGDRVLVSGTLGDHGIAIMSVREGLEFETVLESDTAPLGGLAETILEACPRTRCMRDPTRGGLSSALNELAVASGVGVYLDEAAIPLRPEVRGACEMLGLDPLYVANEGKLIAVVPPEDAGRVLEAMRAHPRGRDAALVGEVVDDPVGMVILRSRIGGERVVTLLAGEQLPRIC